MSQRAAVNFQCHFPLNVRLWQQNRLGSLCCSTELLMFLFSPTFLLLLLPLLIPFVPNTCGPIQNSLLSQHVAMTQRLHTRPQNLLTSRSPVFAACFFRVFLPLPSAACVSCTQASSFSLSFSLSLRHTCRMLPASARDHYLAAASRLRLCTGYELASGAERDAQTESESERALTQKPAIQTSSSSSSSVGWFTAALRHR